MSSLPPNWQEVTDPSSGRKYYFNTVTRVTSWTLPTPAPVGPPSLPPVIPPVGPPTLPPAHVAPVGPPSIPMQAPVGPPSIPNIAPVGPPFKPNPAPVGPPSMHHVAPVGPPSIPNVAPVGPPSIPNAAPVGPPSIPNTAPVGPPSIPNTTPMAHGTASGRPSFAQTLPPAATALPAPWKETATPDGRMYYFNTVTRETTWVRPGTVPTGPPSIPVNGAVRPGPPTLNLGSMVSAPPSVPSTPSSPMARSGPPQFGAPVGPPGTTMPPPVLAALPPNWQSTTSKDGRTYYFNTITKETSWNRPGGVVPPPVVVPPAPFASGPPQLRPSSGSIPPPFRPSTGPPPMNMTGPTGGAPVVGQWESPIPSPAGSASTHFFAGPTATSTSITENSATASGPQVNRSREGTLQHRYGLMKKYHTVFATLSTQPGSLNVFEKDDRKKAKVTITLNKCVVTPHLKGDKFTFVISEFDSSDKVTIDNVEGHAKDYYFAANDPAEVKAWMSSLEANGARLRIPSWEGQTDRNKKPCYIEVYHNKILMFKSNMDDEPDVTLPLTSSCQFDAQPETGIDFDYLVHGRITANTFRIMESGEDGIPVHFITCSSSTDHQNACDAIASLVEKYHVRLAPEALIEGYVFKANQAGTKWTRRYCIVHPNRLVYYKHKSRDDKPTEVNLPDGFEVRVIGNRDPTKPNQFRVSESGDAGTRHYFLCAVNKEAFTNWSKALLDLQKSKLIKKFEKSVNEGYLFLSSNNKKWTKKFFCLMDDKLLVYEARHDTKEIQTFPITGANIVSKEGVVEAVTPVTAPGPEAESTTGVFSGDSPDFVFSMVPNNDITAVRTYFATSSAYDTDEWVKNIASLVSSKNPYVYTDSLMEGYLLKANKKSHKGERRYFIIRDGKLYYLHTRNEDLAKAKYVDLPGDAPCFIVRDSNAPPHTFCVQTSGESGAKAVYVNCTSDKERDEWVEAVRKVKATRPCKRDENSIREGYIYKASTNGKNWSKRYVMVYSDRLDYMKTKNDQKPSGTIQLPPGFVVNRFGSRSTTTVTGRETQGKDAHADDDDDEEFAGVVDDSRVVSAAGSYFGTDPSGLNLYYVAPSTDKDVRKFWMTCDDPDEAESWIALFKELSSSSTADRFPNANREGYLVVNADSSTIANRKYAVLYNDRVDIYNRKIDPKPNQSITLAPGFDIQVQEGDEFQLKHPIALASMPSSKKSDYTTIASGNSSELRSWFDALTSIQNQVTTKDAHPIVLSGYLYCEKAPFANPLIITDSLMHRELRYVVISSIGFYIFENRGQFYPDEERYVRAGKAAVPNYNNAISTSVINEGTLTAEKLIVIESGDTPLSFSIRIAEYSFTMSARHTLEKQRWVNTVRRVLQQAASNYGRIATPVKNAAFVPEDIAPPPPEDDDPPPPPPPEDDDFPAPPPPFIPSIEEDSEEEYVPKKPHATQNNHSSSDRPSSSESYIRPPVQEVKKTGGLSFKPPSFGSFQLPTFDLAPPTESSLPPPPSAFDLPPPGITPPSASKKVVAPVAPPADDDDSDDDAPPPAPVKKK